MKFNFLLNNMLDESYWDVSGYVRSAIDAIWFTDEHEEMIMWLKKAIEEDCL